MRGVKTPPATVMLQVTQGRGRGWREVGGGRWEEGEGRRGGKGGGKMVEGEGRRDDGRR